MSRFFADARCSIVTRMLLRTASASRCSMRSKFNPAVRGASSVGLKSLHSLNGLPSAIFSAQPDCRKRSRSSPSGSSRRTCATCGLCSRSGCNSAADSVTSTMPTSAWRSSADAAHLSSVTSVTRSSQLAPASSAAGMIFSGKSRMSVTPFQFFLSSATRRKKRRRSGASLLKSRGGPVWRKFVFST